MQLSTKTRYAIRALVELALHDNKEPYMLKEIARRQDISNKYLEQLMSPLRAQNLVYTVRGNRGGYLLSRPPEEITIFDILQALEGSLAPAPCLDKKNICNRTDICAIRDMWSELHQTIAEKLKNTTLAELAEKQSSKQIYNDNTADYII